MEVHIGDVFSHSDLFAQANKQRTCMCHRQSVLGHNFFGCRGGLGESSHSSASPNVKRWPSCLVFATSSEDCPTSSIFLKHQNDRARSASRQEVHSRGLVYYLRYLGKFDVITQEIRRNDGKCHKGDCCFASETAHQRKPFKYIYVVLQWACSRIYVFTHLMNRQQSLGGGACALLSLLPLFCDELAPESVCGCLSAQRSRKRRQDVIFMHLTRRQLLFFWFVLVMWAKFYWHCGLLKEFKPGSHTVNHWKVLVQLPPWQTTPGKRVFLCQFFTDKLPGRSVSCEPPHSVWIVVCCCSSHELSTCLDQFLCSYLAYRRTS